VNSDFLVAIIALLPRQDFAFTRIPGWLFALLCCLWLDFVSAAAAVEESVLKVAVVWCVT
jgi:hypothetical protein